jgi:hypothetical protein
MRISRPVRLAYQPPASSTFLSDEPTTSNQPTVLFSQNKSAPVISHPPNEQADCICFVVSDDSDAMDII